ncbi:MAG: hypothetical protein R3C39_09200 [Dehalococcoidia bacterium]
MAGGPEIATAALLVREDGTVLLVQHHEGHTEFGGRWSLPMHVVGDEEVAEDALERLLREVLHVEPGPYEFAETLYLSGEAGGRYIVNVFTCVAWGGEPRYTGRAYADGAWARPGAAGAIDLDPDVRAWLFDAFSEDAAAAAEPGDERAIVEQLTDARDEMLAAFEAIPHQWHDNALDEAWSPLDVLAEAAAVEAYTLDEAQRLLVPGHTWRDFNDDQWAADYRVRPPETFEEIHSRLDETRANTRAWIEQATPEQLATFGNHLERGVVTVADRLEDIARREREHVARLRRMRDAAQMTDGALPLSNAPTDESDDGASTGA